MKITVTIEAETIQQYTEAVKALAAGYTVEPVTIEVPVPVEVPVQVEKEEKPKKARTGKAAAKPEPTKEVDKPAETPKEEKDTPAPKTEEKAVEKETKPAKQESTISFIDVKATAVKLGNLPDGKADVKFILGKLDAAKLSDLKEEQYETFVEMAKEAMDTPKVEKQVETKQDAEEKDAKPEEITLAMIRSKAKELSVAGLGDDIRGKLKTFGAKSLTTLTKDQYNDFYAALGEINA
ncbi:hypothetical protein vBBceSLY5_0027 [Bacillus phage vB_BceS_LY5]|uniref:hypothetical protein n=1 Tax=Bacillus phage vB_BceS_LY5 TaxID=2996058 RepID=UPI00405507AD|nr:hypothetical protein vBBceSLY5_0027 [Bacillus phage vB_BceS_LY5]